MTYRRILMYIFAIIKRNHFKMYMFGVVGETRAHDYFEVLPKLSTTPFKVLLRHKFYYQKYIKSFTLELLADFLGRFSITRQWRALMEACILYLLFSGNAPPCLGKCAPRGIFFPLDEQTFLVENFRNGLVCLVFLLKNTKNSQQLCVLIAVTAKPFLFIT